MIRFLYNNILKDSVLTVTNEDLNYPIENIYDSRLSKKYRSVSTTIRILYDAGLGNTLNPTAITINSHNISNTAQIKVEGNATDSWGSPTVSETLTWNENIMLEFISGSALRYWSIYINDAANVDGYIEIGHAFLGTYLLIDMPLDPKFTFNIIENSVKSRTPTGQVLGHNSGTWLKGFNVTLQFITNTEKNNLITMYEVVRDFVPFYLVLDENNLDKIPVIYCTIENKRIEFDQIGAYNWDLPLEIMEAK